MPDSPSVAYVHARHAHNATTVTSLCSAVAGPPFSFTGHAKDIYAPSLNPASLLRRKLLADRFAVTCTEASARHLRAIAPEATLQVRYHGLKAAEKGFDVVVDGRSEPDGDRLARTPHGLCREAIA